ncbi:MAG: undecaprenyl-diphosphate phosphatase [Burkholderiaceae bacterium]
MDTLLLIKAAILGIVEGLTEFLPISSTGHLILVGSLLNFTGEKAKVFDIAIQTGAIIAVIMLYWQRCWGTVAGLAHDPKSRKFAVNVVIAVLPAILLGLLLGKFIKSHLFTPQVVATTFILGGIIILWVEKRQQSAPRVDHLDDLSWQDSLKVGLIQCLAMIPGTSRSGATIIGGMLIGLSRKTATEFSFFLAIPTLIGAGAYSLYKERALLSAADIPMFAVGLVFAFLSAWLCIKWLIKYVSSHTFVPFAWYRIVFGVIVLITAYTGAVDWHG